MINLLLQFVFAFLGTLGFTFIFNVPKKQMPVAAAIGGVGWVIYQVSVSADLGIALSCFLGACAVGITSDIASRVFKEAATIFVIPGVLPLVPGAGTYYTILAAVEGNLPEAAEKGVQTLAMAGAIALGLLVTGSILQMIRSISARKNSKSA